MGRALTADDVRRMLTRAAARAGSQRVVAAALHVTQQYLSDVLRGRREISDTLAQRAGLRRVIRFEYVDADALARGLREVEE